MTDVSDIALTKTEVCKSIEKMLPKTTEKIWEEDFLCYFIQMGKEIYPVVDFTRKMDYNPQKYKIQINKSVEDYYKK